MKQVMSYIGMLQQHTAERIDRGATWSDPEVEELLNIWTNENVQAELKEATIKKHIFERIARNLREKGFYRTAEQCREKIKRLKKEYRQAKNNNYRCVRGRATVKFFPRLQAVLDGGRGPPCRTTTFYDGADFPPGGDREGVPFSFHNNNHSNASPHSFSESEEIKVEVNPAEVDNDSYMHSEPGEPDLELAESTPAPNAHSRRNRHPPIHSSPWRNYPHHNTHSISSHLHAAPVHQPITISIPHAHRNNNNNSSSNNNNNNNGVLSRPPPNIVKEEQDIHSEASSSRATSPSPLTPAPNSPLSPHLRRKRLKRSRSQSNQGLAMGVKETFEITVERFLKHQREAEDRQYAWEERRIQLEFEAEERWRQEDREMLQQIISQLQHNPTNSQPSPLSGSQSNSSHDH